MKIFRILLNISIVTSLISCRKTCEKAPVELPGSACSSVWNKTFGGSDREDVARSVRTADGGYIIVGSTLSADGDMANTGAAGDFTVYAKKINASGENVWVKAYLKGDDDFPYEIIPATDGGYIIAGFTTPDRINDPGNMDTWIFKIDEQGNKVWEATWGGTKDDGAIGVVAEPDGYLVSCFARSRNGDLPSNNEVGTWVLKYDLNGNFLWQKAPFGLTYTSPLRINDVSSRMIPATDGGYIVVSRAYDFINNNVQNDGSFVYKIDNAGNVQWQKRFPNANSTLMENIAATSDGGYILAGWIDVNGDGDILVMKLNQSGDQTWTKQYGGTLSETGIGVMETDDHRYLVVGQTFSTDGIGAGNHGNADAVVLKLDASGNKIDQKLLGGSGVDIGQIILKGSDCGYLMIGIAESSDGDVPNNKGGSDVWMYKFSF